MNKFFPSFKIFLFFSVFKILFSQISLSQTPQFYNLNTGTWNNLFPFGAGPGCDVQWLIEAHEFNRLYPSPSGYITSFYFLMGSSATVNFTDLTIKMGQTTITSLPPGVKYTGPMDTVFYKHNYTLTSSTGHWMKINLDTPFTYDTSLSLVAEVSQCSASPSYAMNLRQSFDIGIRRSIMSPSGSCVFNFYYQDSSVINCGIDIVPLGLPPKSYYFTQWCPANTYPQIPVPSVYGAADVLGDTVYLEIGSTDGSTASQLFYKYSISGNNWSSGTPLPSARCQGTLTACKGKLYYIGGAQIPSGTPSTNVYAYNPETGQWTEMTDAYEGKSGHSAFNWKDSVILFAGGSWGGSMNSDVQYFRADLNNWFLSTAFLGFDLVYAQSGGIIGNTFYMAGGRSLNSNSRQLVTGTFGPAASTVYWVAGPPYPSSGKMGAGGVGVRGRFYFIGGKNFQGPAATDSTFFYDITAGQWGVMTGIKPHPSAFINASTVAWIHDDSVRVACLGGADLNSSATPYFDVIGCGAVESGIPRVRNFPLIYSLKQNYPNPFNPTTTIEFYIAKANNVTLKVYDMLGREVSTLMNERKSAGFYSVNFDATNISSGVYFYRLTSGEFTDAKKMVVMR